MFRLIGLLFLVSFSAVGLTLEPVPNAPVDRLPIKMDQPNYPCSEIADRLEAYNKMARSHDQSLTAFLGQLVEKVSSWYNLLHPLENTTTTLEADTFLPLQQGAVQVTELTNLAFDNSELLAIELDRIIVSLKQCEFK